MIYVNRSTVKVPAVLVDKKKRGVRETKKNIKFADLGKWDKLSYSAYSHDDVKDALRTLFKGKCAYCESKFLHVYPGDVEHFRPKGEIEEALPNTKPGYYWLAADWNNLLLSCRNCNQKLKHLIYGETSKATLGKMNQFPLQNNARHLQTHNHTVPEFNTEEQNRLLINPCIEDPEQYFQYESMGVIKPKQSRGKEFEMAKNSIRIYVLQRMPLVQAREKVMIEISAQIQRVLEALQNLSNSMVIPELKAHRLIFDKVLKREVVRLKKFTNDDEEFSGMARQVINEFINRHFPSP